MERTGTAPRPRERKGHPNDGAAGGRIVDADMAEEMLAKEVIENAL